MRIDGRCRRSPRLQAGGGTSYRGRSARLTQRMRTRKGVVLHTGVDDTPDGREWPQVVLEKVCAHRLTDQANVGNGDVLALAVAPGFFAVRQVCLDRSERFPDPVLDPFQSRWLVEL